MAIQGEVSTLINGNVFSWQEIHVYMNNIPIILGAFIALDYTAKQENKLVYGGGQVAPKGKTPGNGSVEGSFTMFISDWDSFNQQITQLTTSDGTTFNTDFSFVISYAVGDTYIRTDTVSGIRLGQGQTTKGSSDEIVKVVQFTATQLLDNGIPAFKAGGGF